MSHTPLKRTWLLLVVAICFVVATVASAPAVADAELAALRRATAPFHSVDIATAAGWDTVVTPCLESPLGGMGYHYANFALLLDGGALDPSRPEALLYEPRANGSLRLVAVEFIILEEDLPSTAPPPTLFGQSFHFNHKAGLWALHVWLWRHNPSGMFADWNPNVSCQFAS